MPTAQMEVPEITDLAVIATENIQVTFSTPGQLTPLLESIAERARSFVADVDTARGRKDIASLAAKIAKAKTAIDGIGKDLVDDLKSLPKRIDASRKEARDFLDKLRDEIRQPLTDWEAEEQLHIEALTAQLEAERLAKEIENAHELANFMNADFDRERAAKKAAQEQASKDNEARIAREAKERAEQEAEEKALKELEAAARREREFKEAKERAERDKVAAEHRAKEAEERAAREKVEAEQRAERERLASIEREEKAKAEAVDRERQRVEEEKRKAEAEQASREANVRHRKKVLSEISKDLQALGMMETIADIIVKALSEGKIRHTEVKF